MFARVLTKNFKTKFSLSKAMFGSTEAVKGRVKVADKLIWVNVKNIQGEWQKIGCYEGESMMSAMKRNKVMGMAAECYGGDPESPAHELPHDFYSQGPMCNLCKVVMSPETSQKIPMSTVEQYNVEHSPAPVTKEHRLA